MEIGRALLLPPVRLPLLETGRERESMTMVRKKTISVILAAWNVSGSLPATSTITNRCRRFSSRRKGVLMAAGRRGHLNWTWRR